MTVINAGKGESIWDRFTQVGGNIDDNSTGNIACDSYNKYTEDVRLLKNLGVSIYKQISQCISPHCVSLYCISLICFSSLC